MNASVETLTMQEAITRLSEFAKIVLVRGRPLAEDEERERKSLAAFLAIMRDSAHLSDRDIAFHILRPAGEVLRRGKYSRCGCSSCEAKAKEDL